jgi:hypothetical protein
MMEHNSIDGRALPFESDAWQTSVCNWGRLGISYTVYCTLLLQAQLVALQFQYSRGTETSPERCTNTYNMTWQFTIGMHIDIYISSCTKTSLISCFNMFKSFSTFVRYCLLEHIMNLIQCASSLRDPCASERNNKWCVKTITFLFLYWEYENSLCCLNININ